MKLIERLIEEGGGSRNFVGPEISENVVRLIGRHFPSYVESDSSKKKKEHRENKLKGLRKGPLTAKNLRLMVTKFEETGSLNVRSGTGKKPVSAKAIEKVALQVKEDKSSNVLASTSVRRVEEAMDLPRSTV
ncbi:hypothetical protein TNCV_1021271 [Trichonephila clavipes]|uniref:Uncharacterized protein n=1 Tax=Trichonephila clavipes TaxID=2585209 RepID=A0A8X6VDG8_TRICX|nr:hypothetical protein TNCV_1021271 [Trichonephila clavipes]